MGQYECIGTLNGPVVLQHTEYEIFMCYNAEEHCWQVQASDRVLCMSFDEDAYGCHVPAKHNWVEVDGVPDGGQTVLF